MSKSSQLTAATEPISGDADILASVKQHVMAPQPAPPRSNLLRHLVYILKSNPMTLIAFILFALMLVAALLGPLITPYDPLKSSVADALQAPSLAHWFGTDDLGRDVFARVLMATRLDLAIAFSAVAISFVFGSIIGSLSGYYGGWLDRITGRIVDTIMAFSLFVLAMGIVAAQRQGFFEKRCDFTAIVNSWTH